MLHRYRVVLPNKKHETRSAFSNPECIIDFGCYKTLAYVDHKDPVRMRLELHLRGACIPKAIRDETDDGNIQRMMLMVDTSTKYDWSDAWSADYWDRWLLQSYPTMEMAKLYMSAYQNVSFMPLDEDGPFYVEDG